MKLIFFLVAFCLVCIRVFVPWSNRNKEKREWNMLISSDNFKEEISCRGKIVLTDDEKDFKSMSPGGYLKFHINDTSVKAESNLQGDIEYGIYEGKNKITAADRQKTRIAWAIREMVYWGFDADNRMERVFRRGGARALLAEVDSVHSDWLKEKYLERLIGIDSLSMEDRRALMKKLATVGSDPAEGQLLRKVSITQLLDSETSQAYFQAIDSMHFEPGKFDILRHLVKQDSLSEKLVSQILSACVQPASDFEKADLFRTLLEKGVISGDRFDSLLALISHMESDMNKADLYKRLAKQKVLTEQQWIGLIESAGQLESDFDKAQVLTEIAGEMSKTENLKAAYRAAAKSIRDDMAYGRAIRALE